MSNNIYRSGVVRIDKDSKPNLFRHLPSNGIPIAKLENMGRSPGRNYHQQASFKGINLRILIDKSKDGGWLHYELEAQKRSKPSDVERAWNAISNLK